MEILKMIILKYQHEDFKKQKFCQLQLKEH